MSLWIDRQAIRRCNARHTRPITRLEIEFAANRYPGRHKESISERKSRLRSAKRTLIVESILAFGAVRNEQICIIVGLYFSMLFDFIKNVTVNFNLQL